MELQWPLIIFTALIAWSAGVFATQGVYALRGSAKRAQMPSLITGIVILLVAGIAVFTHLKHWERIFNGFGHITSGITQELIGIVVVVIVAFLFFVFMRRSDDGTSVPTWCAVLMIVAPAALDIVMAHSYLMAGRPAWNTVLWITFILGNSCVLGPATVAIIATLRGEKRDDTMGLTCLIGSAVNLFAGVMYYIFLFVAADSGLAKVTHYFDPTNPTADVTESVTSVASIVGANAPLFIGAGLIIGAIVPVVAAYLGRKGDDKRWVVWCAVALVCALIGAFVGRIAFYQSGLTVLQLY